MDEFIIPREAILGNDAVIREICDAANEYEWN